MYSYIIIILAVLVVVPVSVNALENVTLAEFVVSYPEQWTATSEELYGAHDIGFYPLEQELPMISIVVINVYDDPLTTPTEYDIAGLPAEYDYRWDPDYVEHELEAVNPQTGNTISVILRAEPFNHEKYLPMWENLIRNITISPTI